MDDREAVALILGGDQDGLADVYDRYAASLYGYCRALLPEPADAADAADAVQDTFVVASARLGGLRDPRKLRPWLYAVARNECFRKLNVRDAPAEFGETEDLSETAQISQLTQRRELRELVQTAISGLNPQDREVVELDLRHDLEGGELAAVFGVARSNAHAMVSRARTEFEKALGALLVARAGRRACLELDRLLADWDGRLTIPLRKRVIRHIDRCDECGERRRRALPPAMRFGIPAPPMIPPMLRSQVLRLCADQSPTAVEVRAAIARHAGSFGPNGFPRPLRAPRPGPLREPSAGIVAALSVAAAAAVVIAMIALRGAPPSTLDARSGTAASSAGAGAAAASASSRFSTGPAPSPTPAPSRSSAAAHRRHPAPTPPALLTTPPYSYSPRPTHSPKPAKSPRPTKSPTHSPSPSGSPSPSSSPSSSPSPTPTPTPTTTP